MEDHDRVLNERGRAAASRMGAWLQAQGHVPDLILSSTAARAAETAELIKAEFEETPKIDHISGLYHASPDTILQKIRVAGHGDVMVVGHNPGMGSFADLICDSRPKHDRFTAYPTTATLIAEVMVEDWKELKFGEARQLNFVVPRELKGLET